MRRADLEVASPAGVFRGDRISSLPTRLRGRLISKLKRHISDTFGTVGP